MRGITLALAALAGCSPILGLRDVSLNDAEVPDGGAGDRPSGNAVSYESTNTRGELARWDVEGATLTGTWDITDSAGTVMETLTITATCGNPDASYGTRSCTVTSATCTGSCAAGDAPSTGAIYTTLELPGVALVVVGVQGAHTVLHVGLTLNTGCPADGAFMTDYVSAYVGIAHPQIFGISRLTAGFDPFTHANFVMGPGACTPSTPTGSCASTPSIVDVDATDGSDNKTFEDCKSGIQMVRLRSGPIRAMRSGSGASIVAIPEYAGTVSFPMAQAAAISDFASRTFVGVLSSDSGPPIGVAATTGPVSSGAVPIASIQFNADQLPFFTSPVIKPAINATSTLASPAYPNFTAAPQGSYMNNTVLQPAFPTVSQVPGLFVLDGMTAPNNSRLIFVAGKQNGKLVGIGASYDWGNNLPGYAGASYLSVSMLVLFEKST
jgi:hypothetical protein